MFCIQLPIPPRELAGLGNYLATQATKEKLIIIKKSKFGGEGPWRILVL